VRCHGSGDAAGLARRMACASGKALRASGRSGSSKARTECTGGLP
jgi:hypothetical protein